jgi:hypothetical protein
MTSHTHIYMITIPNARSLCSLLITGLHMWCSPFKGTVTVRTPCLSCTMSTCYISQTHLKCKIWKYTVHFKSWRQHFFVAVRFKVVTAVTMKNAVFWDVTACTVIENCQCFRWIQSTTPNMENHKFPPDYTALHPRINVFFVDAVLHTKNRVCKNTESVIFLNS